MFVMNFHKHAVICRKALFMFFCNYFPLTCNSTKELNLKNHSFLLWFTFLQSLGDIPVSFLKIR